MVSHNGHRDSRENLKSPGKFFTNHSYHAPPPSLPEASTHPASGSPQGFSEVSGLYQTSQTHWLHSRNDREGALMGNVLAPFFSLDPKSLDSHHVWETGVQSAVFPPLTCSPWQLPTVGYRASQSQRRAPRSAHLHPWPAVWPKTCRQDPLFARDDCSTGSEAACHL